MTVWIVGTSVSIQNGGYSTRLSAALGTNTVCNLSIGDQTSIMGLSRFLMHRDAIQPGDVLIWEYALLDILMSKFFDPEETMAAARMIWNGAQRRGANVLAVLITPRDHLTAPSQLEEVIRVSAINAGIDVTDLREIFAKSGITDPANHYSDSRHPNLDSPVLDNLADVLLQKIQQLNGVPVSTLHDFGTQWQWINADKLFPNSAVITRKNSLFSLTARKIDQKHVGVLPENMIRLIHLAVIADEKSGTLWCGHQGCFPASCMQKNNRLPFSMRGTRIPCVRRETKTIQIGPSYILRGGVWADYGFQIKAEVSGVELVGALIESANVPD